MLEPDLWSLTSLSLPRFRNRDWRAGRSEAQIWFFWAPIEAGLLTFTEASNASPDVLQEANWVLGKINAKKAKKGGRKKR